MNMGEWCEKEGIKWFTIDTMDKLFDYIGIEE